MNKNRRATRSVSRLTLIVDQDITRSRAIIRKLVTRKEAVFFISLMQYLHPGDIYISYLKLMMPITRGVYNGIFRNYTVI